MAYRTTQDCLFSVRWVEGCAGEVFVGVLVISSFGRSNHRLVPFFPSASASGVALQTSLPHARRYVVPGCAVHSCHMQVGCPQALAIGIARAKLRETASHRMESVDMKHGAS